jgi:hypothetical protein
VVVQTTMTFCLGLLTPKTNTEVILLVCPEDTIHGQGPVFEHIDDNTVYVLVKPRIRGGNY